MITSPPDGPNRFGFGPIRRFGPPNWNDDGYMEYNGKYPEELEKLNSYSKESILSTYNTERYTLSQEKLYPLVCISCKRLPRIPIQAMIPGQYYSVSHDCPLCSSKLSCYPFVWIENLLQRLHAEEEIKKASLLHEQGLKYYQQGETIKAIKDFESALLINPDDADIHFSFAEALLIAKNKEDAYYHFSRAQILGNENAERKIKSHFRYFTAFKFLRKENPTLRNLTKKLQSKDHSEQLEAIKALGELRNADATNILLQFSSKNNEKDIEIELTRALDKIKDYRSFDHLLNFFCNENKDTETRDIAAHALNTMRDKRVVYPIISHLKDGGYSREVAAILIGKFGDYALEELKKRSNQNEDIEFKKGIILALKSLNLSGGTNILLQLMENKELQQDAIEAFEEISNVDIPTTIPYLKNWIIGKVVGKKLLELNWEPASDEEAVHLLLAIRKGDSLKENWNVTKNILLKDVGSQSYTIIENALFGFIALGRLEIIPTLIAELNSNGNKTMAVAYLNCGQSDLKDAAKNWAALNGYRIIESGGTMPVVWGSM